MKKLKYSVLIAILFLLGCEEYLDKVEDKQVITSDDVYSEYDKYRKYADYMYELMFDENKPAYSADKSRNANGYIIDHTMCLSDECEAGKENYKLDYWLVGDYKTVCDGFGKSNGMVNGWYPWDLSWDGIRLANDVIINLGKIKDATQLQKDELHGQALFMRAQYYFILAQRWGGMPYFHQPLNVDDNLAFERPPYTETIENIAADCDEAFSYLPDQWDSDNTGRPTKAAALMLKSRALLYDASPQWNPENDLSKWEKAAVAAWDVISYAYNTGYYELIQCTEAASLDVASVSGADYAEGNPAKLKAYREIFLNNPINKEIIWNDYRGTTNYGYGNLYPLLLLLPLDYAYWGSNCNAPSQNLVDMFETKDGYPIDHPSSGYNLQNPYVNRDPRFYNNILFNEVRWPNDFLDNKLTLELFTSGQEGETGEERWRSDRPATQQSKTGYLVRKLWPIGIHKNNNQQFFANSIFYRLAEAYLNYAEAANEAYGPNGSAPGAGLTAVQAINSIRSRVGMPDVLNEYTTSKEAFRPRIRNERNIELCFESSHRWFDIRRWKILTTDEVRNIRSMEIYWEGVNAQYPTGYRYSVNSSMAKRIFEDRHYLYPIPEVDVTIYEEFKQNPGW